MQLKGVVNFVHPEEEVFDIFRHKSGIPGSSETSEIEENDMIYKQD